MQLEGWNWSHCTVTYAANELFFVHKALCEVRNSLMRNLNYKTTLKTNKSRKNKNEICLKYATNFGHISSYFHIFPYLNCWWNSIVELFSQILIHQNKLKMLCYFKSKFWHVALYSGSYYFPSCLRVCGRCGLPVGCWTQYKCELTIRGEMQSSTIRITTNTINHFP